MRSRGWCGCQASLPQHPLLMTVLFQGGQKFSGKLLAKPWRVCGGQGARRTGHKSAGSGSRAAPRWRRSAQGCQTCVPVGYRLTRNFYCFLFFFVRRVRHSFVRILLRKNRPLRAQAQVSLSCTRRSSLGAGRRCDADDAVACPVVSKAATGRARTRDTKTHTA